MSRRKKQQPAKRSQEGSTAVVEPDGTLAVANGRYRRLFLIAAALVALWLAVLVALVVFPANPVTLNRRQLRASSQIVTAEVLDAAEGKVKVVKVFRGSGKPGSELTIEGLQELGVRNGRTYILPLYIPEKRAFYRVTPAPDSPDRQPVPATDDAVKQLAEFVGSTKNSGR